MNLKRKLFVINFFECSDCEEQQGCDCNFENNKTLVELNDFNEFNIMPAHHLTVNKLKKTNKKNKQKTLKDNVNTDT